MVEIKKRTPLTPSGHCPLRIPDQKAFISYREVMMYQLPGSFYLRNSDPKKPALGEPSRKTSITISHDTSWLNDTN